MPSERADQDEAVAGGLVAGLGLALCGCATIARGTVARYPISTHPAGALATSSTGAACRTPCTLPVDRQDAFTVDLSLDGYRSRRVEVDTRLSSSDVSHAVENLWSAGVGLVVDTVTGATLEHVPGQISVALIRR